MKKIRKTSKDYRCEYKILNNDIQKLKGKVFERLKFLSKKFPNIIFEQNITSDIISSTNDINSIDLETQLKLIETIEKSIKEDFIQKTIEFPC